MKDGERGGGVRRNGMGARVSEEAGGQRSHCSAGTPRRGVSFPTPLISGHGLV